MKRSGKLLALMLAVLLLASVLPLSALAAELPFEDVPADAWYYPVVKEAYEKGITNGTSATTFEPNATVTREMFLVMLFRAAGIDLNLYEQMLAPRPGLPLDLLSEVYPDYRFCTDVQLGTWYTAAVACAVDNGVTMGVDDAHFGVGRPITREQMAAMAKRFTDAFAHIALTQIDDPVSAFSDMKEVSAWARDAVNAMRLAGVMQGDELQNVNPQNDATRAEAAAVLLRLANAVERVSFVPKDTSWIKLSYLYKGVHYLEIKDPAAVQEMLRHLDQMPITTAEAFPSYSGWLYMIEFLDENDQPLTGFRFESGYVIVDNVRLHTDNDYFLPWTQMFED